MNPVEFVEEFTKWLDDEMLKCEANGNQQRRNSRAEAYWDGRQLSNLRAKEKFYSLITEKTQLPHTNG